MTAPDKFPEDLLLHEPDRGARLVREFYQQYHDVPPIPDHYPKYSLQHEAIKADFYRQWLERNGHDKRTQGLDVGCRSGLMIKLVGAIEWVGVDIDRSALEIARAAGVPCAEMDFTSAIGLRDESFDIVMMTEVLEHLPYPSIIVGEVHRILKIKPASGFVGSVPLDYHLHRRWKVLRGKRLSGDQTHVHHFSFNELDQLLRFYFDKVEYLPLSGTTRRHPRLKLPYNLFVRDIAWAASSPKSAPGRWNAGQKF